MHDEERQRTKLQNKCIHKYCALLADEMNGAGYTFKKVMNDHALTELEKVLAWLDNTPLNPDSMRRQLMTKLAGLERAFFFGDMHWTMIMVKNFIWRKIQITMFDKESTTELTTKECKAVYEQISQLMAERFGIDIPWPSLDSLSESQREIR